MSTKKNRENDGREVETTKLSKAELDALAGGGCKGCIGRGGLM